MVSHDAVFQRYICAVIQGEESVCRRALSGIDIYISTQIIAIIVISLDFHLTGAVECIDLFVEIVLDTFNRYITAGYRDTSVDVSRQALVIYDRGELTTLYRKRCLIDCVLVDRIDLAPVPLNRRFAVDRAVLIYDDRFVLSTRRCGRCIASVSSPPLLRLGVDNIESLLVERSGKFCRALLEFFVNV